MGHGTRYSGKVLILHAIDGQFCHVARRGVVPILIKAMGIFKAGLGHAELLGLVVHQLRKLLYAVRRMQRKRGGGTVAGDEQQTVE